MKVWHIDFWKKHTGGGEDGFYMFGEPLLDRNLEKYISHAKELGASYTFFTTNGVLLNKERMISFIDSGIDSIKLSINGGNRNQYLFAYGVDNFQQVKDNVIRYPIIERKLERILKYMSVVC